MMSTRSAGRGASARATIPATAPVGSTRTPGRRSPCRNAGTKPAGHLRSTRGLRGIGPGYGYRGKPPERANRGQCTWSPARRRRRTVVVVNWEDDPRDASLPLGAVGIKGAKFDAYDVWRDAPVTDLKDFTLEPRSARTVAIRPAVARPQVIGTTRHVVQGAVD